MAFKIIVTSLISVILLIALLSRNESNTYVRQNQKKDILSWVESCPKDATLTMKSHYYWDKDTGSTNILMAICVTNDHKNDKAL